MSYHQELDEYPKHNLLAELARREAAVCSGNCDYCGRSGLAKPCRMTDRHEEARQQAERLGHVLCGKYMSRGQCDKIAKHTAYGSLTYHACDEHNDEIQAKVTSE